MVGKKSMLGNHRCLILGPKSAGFSTLTFHRLQQKKIRTEKTLGVERGQGYYKPLLMYQISIQILDDKIEFFKVTNVKKIKYI